MDWVPDLIGTPARREEHGPDASEKRIVERRELFDESESETAVEIESQTEKSCETESCEKSCEAEIRKTQSCEKSETESGQTEIVEQRLQRRQRPGRGRAQRGRRRRR